MMLGHHAFIFKLNTGIYELRGISKAFKTSKIESVVPVTNGF